MKSIKKIFIYLFCFLALGVLFSACQKMSRPALGDYPKDANPPGGPLKFYTAFDGTSSNVLLNAVDSIRANFPADNPSTTVDGISGKAVQCTDPAFIKYAGPNDFASTASSFTVSFWEKCNGVPPNLQSAFPFSITSSNGHWSGGTMFLLFDHAGAGATNNLANLSFVLVDKDMHDTWLQWNGSNMVPGIQDNTWHHLAFVYDASTSNLTLYVDGVANSHVPQWTNHGPVNLDASKVTGLLVGGKCVSGWGQSFHGSLDQFRLYATALSASEVADLHTGKK